MKVGTDSMSLGAWATPQNRGRLLDIGTGSGLLALMIAQRFENIQVDAVEIDGQAAHQAQKNFEKSPWKSRLNAFQADVTSFQNPDHSYQSFICNPPFFEVNLQIANDPRSTARQQRSLDLEQLLNCCQRLGTEDHHVFVILPVSILPELERCRISEGYYMRERCFLKPTWSKPANRCLIHLDRTSDTCNVSEMTIEAERHSFTSEYRQLVEPFYLNPK